MELFALSTTGLAMRKSEDSWCKECLYSCFYSIALLVNRNCLQTTPREYIIDWQDLVMGTMKYTFSFPCWWDFITDQNDLFWEPQIWQHNLSPVSLCKGYGLYFYTCDDNPVMHPQIWQSYKIPASLSQSYKKIQSTRISFSVDYWRWTSKNDVFAPLLFLLILRICLAESWCMT